MKKGEHQGRKVPGGRGLYDFAAIRDIYGNTITIRLGSHCEPAVWISVVDADGKHYKDGIVGYPGGIAVTTACIDRRAAKLMIRALQKFVQDGAP